MKKITSILILVVITTLSSFKIGEEPKYKFQGTLTYWNYKVSLLENIQSAIKNSDLPAKYANQIVDSLAAFENDIREQIVPQLPKQVNPITDTTHKK